MNELTDVVVPLQDAADDDKTGEALLAKLEASEDEDARLERELQQRRQQRQQMLQQLAVSAPTATAATAAAATGAAAAAPATPHGKSPMSGQTSQLTGGVVKADDMFDFREKKGREGKDGRKRESG